VRSTVDRPRFARTVLSESDRRDAVYATVATKGGAGSVSTALSRCGHYVIATKSGFGPLDGSFWPVSIVRLVRLWHWKVGPNYPAKIWLLVRAKRGRDGRSTKARTSACLLAAGQSSQAVLGRQVRTCFGGALMRVPLERTVLSQRTWRRSRPGRLRSSKEWGSRCPHARPRSRAQIRRPQCAEARADDLCILSAIRA